MKVHCFALVFLFLLPSVANAGMMIDLNDFFFFPGDPVVIAPDGSSATIGEDPAFSPIILSNDPALGDPVVIDTRLGTILSFGYDFSEGLLDNDDEFGAFVIDPLTGLSPGPDYEFVTESSGSGTVVFDLSSLADLGVGPILGLQFQLAALPADLNLDSVVTVSNVQLHVPEPGSLAIWALLAVVAVVVVRRSNANKGVPALLPN